MNKAPGGPSEAKKRAQQVNAADFARSVWLELRRVTWPTRDEWVSATVLTVVLVVGIGIFTWACDWAFAALFGFLHPAL